MMLKSLYMRVLGHPFVYDHIRPAAVGGIDMQPSYDNLQATADDVVLDLGCGTGDALRYLPRVRRYHGFDTDPHAIEAARRRPQSAHPEVQFHARVCTRDDFRQIEPTRVMMSGLLHHLSDAEALELLGWCSGQPTVRRVATNDVVFLPRRPLSNLLARMDRGEHVRAPEAYLELARRAALRVVGARVVRCHPRTGLAYYYLMALEPSRA